MYIFNPLCWLNDGPGIDMNGGNVVLQSFHYNRPTLNISPINCSGGNLCIEGSSFDRRRSLFTLGEEMNDFYFVANNLTGYRPNSSFGDVLQLGLSELKNGHAIAYSNYAK